MQELPDAEPFPEMPRATDPQATYVPEEEPEEESSPSAQAPVRRRTRGRKPLPVDNVQEVRNAQLSAWNNDYLENMAADTRTKLHHRQAFQAKKNAAAWVFGNGINGIGTKFGGPQSELLAINPLSAFSGDALRHALIGLSLTTAGQKHPRTEEAAEGEDERAGSSEGRRTRPRSDEGSQELGRGHDGFTLEEDVSLSTAFFIYILTNYRLLNFLAVTPQSLKNSPPKCPGTALPYAAVLVPVALPMAVPEPAASHLEA